MTKAILAIITPLVPLVVRLVMMWLDKSDEKEEAKLKFLAFIDSIRQDVPPKLLLQNRKALEELRRKISNEEVEKGILKTTMENYRSAYETAYQEKEDAEEKNRKVYAENLKLEDENMKLRGENEKLLKNLSREM